MHNTRGGIKERSYCCMRGRVSVLCHRRHLCCAAVMIAGVSGGPRGAVLMASTC